MGVKTHKGCTEETMEPLPVLQMGTINGSPHAIQGIPHTVVRDFAFCESAQTAAVLVHRANAYPKLVEELRLVRDCTYTDAEGPELRNQNAQNHRRASELLRELGEIE